MNLKSAVFLLLSGIFLASCADDRADLEEASFKLGEGGTANAQSVVDLTTPMLTTAKGAKLLEVNRLYVGAKMQLAGFDSITIISKLVYKDAGSKTIEKVRSALTGLTDNSATLMNDAITQLAAFVQTADFTSSTDVRAQQGLQFQLGLAYLLDSLRIGVKQSGLATSATAATFSQSDCETNLAKESTASTNFKTNLTNANTHFTGTAANGAGLDSTNELVVQVTDLNSALDAQGYDISGLSSTQITDICLAIQAQLN